MQTVEETIRTEGGKVLATLIRLTGDFQLAEDALQEATVAALEQWSEKGVPANPGAWLTRVARNKALDAIRRESKRSEKESEATRLLGASTFDGEATDPLRLLFTCCHPSLAEDASIALTLRTVSQMTTREIARAFLQPEPTVAQRISRAKRKIRIAGIPYRVPSDPELPARLRPVLTVLYVTFTAGYAAFTGRADSRVELGGEAIRLTRMLAELMPDEPEVRGLLALMLTTWARRATRIDADGSLILLERQDRGRWDRDLIDEADRILSSTLRAGTLGPYQVQASIASLHSLAPSFEDTDWVQIAELYAALERLAPTPVVRVNRAVAVSYAEGPEAGRRLLDTLEGDPRVESWHLYWSARAELEARLDNTDHARRLFERALGCQINDTDRAHLKRRLGEM